MEVHPAETLCKMPEAFDAVGTGSVDMASFPYSMNGGVAKEFGAFDLPFMFDNSRAIAAATEDIEDTYSKMMEEQFNQKILFSFCCGGCDLVTTKPVQTVEDWNGMLFATFNPTSTAIIDVMGASSVVVSWTENYQALQKGTMDGVISGGELANAQKLYEVAKYLTVCYILPCSEGTVINLDTWNKMPKQIQDILLDESAQMAQELNEYYVNRYNELIDDLAAQGMEVYYLPKAERDRWRELLRPYVESEIAAMGEIGQKAKKIAEEANSKYPTK
jgi:TRAP-type C4-dicarboxylate transport system substrate-binding protein